MSAFSHRAVFTVALIALLGFSGCCTSPQIPRSVWRKQDFLNRQFTLDDSRRIEYVWFYSDHRMAAVTFGEHFGDIYKTCAPLMFWRLRNGRLQIYDYDKRVYSTWTFIRSEGDAVYVLNEYGKTLRYIRK
jgi:hypothetical protein